MGMKQCPDIIPVEVELRRGSAEQAHNISMADFTPFWLAGRPRRVNAVSEVFLIYAYFRVVSICVFDLFFGLFNSQDACAHFVGQLFEFRLDQYSFGAAVIYYLS